MRRIPIQTKLFAALAVPLIALLTVITYEVVKSSREAHDIREQAELAKAATGPNGVFTALQNERNRAGADLLGFNQGVLKLPVKDNAQARRETDESLAKFEELIDGQGGNVMATYAPAFDKLKEIKTIRADIDAVPPPFTKDDPEKNAIADEVFSRYSVVIDELLKANTKVALAIDDPELRRGADLSHMATRQLDLIARLVRNYLQAGINEDFKLLDRDELREAGGLYGQAKENGDDIDELATGDYKAAGIRLKKFNESRGFMEEVAPEVLRTGVIPVGALLDVVSVPDDESYYGFRTRVKETLETKADDLATSAEERQGRYLGLGILVIVVAGLAVWWVSRSITRPLRALTRQATDMANHRLPDAVLDILDTPLGDDVTVPTVEPIAVKTRDEVADVADALNTVQDSALDLAVEQAVLRRNIADSFVNLGRRNQNLLGRQLDFITELEHNETDPDTLANLFRLDHLATRMRRNAESLLVLAGIDPPRKWAAPVRITDAIRAALGEVEDYQRVTVRAVEATTIVGSAAADLAHLLAELIENALIFSPPDQTVEIRGRSQPAGYTLAIIDSGLGMPPEELSRANRRLAGAESFTIAPSKYLGHYVAGNLAARHNINVTLHNSPGHGITATINLPPTLLTADTDQADNAPGAPNLSATPTLAARRDMFGGDDGRELSPAASVFGSDLADAPAAGLATTTASGLAKRTRRPSEGPGAEQPAARLDRGSLPLGVTQPAVPDDDLIQTLSQYTTQLHQQLGSVPAMPPPAPAGVGTPLSPATGTPALRHMPPFPSTPPRGLVMPPPPPPASPRPGPGPIPGPGPGPEGDGSGLPQRAPLSGRAPLPPGSQPPPAPSGRPPLLPPPGGAPDSGQTPAGLTRRVRGAQLPNTQTVSLRRTTDTGPGTTSPRPPQPPASVGGPFGRTPTGQNPIIRPSDAPQPPQAPPPASPPPPPAGASDEGWASERSAKDVYGFLSDFTAGVQRGLDETKASGNGD